MDFRCVLFGCVDWMDYGGAGRAIGGRVRMGRQGAETDLRATARDAMRCTPPPSTATPTSGTIDMGVGWGVGDGCGQEPADPRSRGWCWPDRKSSVEGRSV